MDRHIELNIGNVLVIGLVAFVMVGGILLASRYFAGTTVPVVDKVGQGALSFYGQKAA